MDVSLNIDGQHQIILIYGLNGETLSGEEITWTDRHAFTIYPIKKRSLSWKEEKEKIFELLNLSILSH